MENSEQVAVLIKISDDDYREVEAIFTGPDAAERGQQVYRLKSMAAEGNHDLDYILEIKMSNPTNAQLGLGAPLPEVATDPFVQAAIADIFVKGQAIVPAWLNVEWLAAEVHAVTNEDIRVNGQILTLDDPPVHRLVREPQDPGDAGFMEYEG